MSTKSDYVDAFIREIVTDAINEVIADQPDHANALRLVKARLICSVAYRATRRYKMLELQDTFDWHSRKVGAKQ